MEERVRYVEDLFLPRLHITQYWIQRYWCRACRKLVERKPTDVLPGHQLGIRAMSYVVYLREELRLPINLVQDHLAKAGLHVTQGEIEHISGEVAEHLRPIYEESAKTLRTAKAINLDETGLQVEGDNDWLWVGATKDPDVVVFKPRRKQRCWAHLLRGTSS